MDKLIYREDMSKIRAKAIKFATIGPLVIVAAALLRGFTQSLNPNDFDGLLRYVIAAIRGSFSVGGIILIVCGGGAFLIGVKLFSNSIKPPATLLSASKEGISFLWHRGQEKNIPLQDVREVGATQKDKMSLVVIYLHDPGAFISAAGPKFGNALKYNLNTYGSPAAVVVDYCAVPNEQIARELNEFLRKVPTL